MACYRSLLVLAIFGGVTACRDRSYPSAENFSTVLQSHLTTEGPCLDVRQWPVEISVNARRSRDRFFRQMDALETAGLVRHVISTKPTIRIDHPDAVRQYFLTANAFPYLKEETVTYQGTHGDTIYREQALCWGSKKLDRIIGWENHQGDSEKIRIIYTYRLADVASWALEPAVIAAFPQISQTMNGERTKQVRQTLTVTPTGWRVTE